MIKIVEKNVDELIPYENNTKLHPQSQIDTIKKSIEQFGFNDPKYCDVIIKRWEALTGQKAEKIC